MIKLHAFQFANCHFPLPSHPKTRGQIAEALFIVAALLRGFIVAKVEGDNAPFDVFLAAGRANYRIQIKSAWKSSAGGYQFVSARSRSNAVPSALARSPRRALPSADGVVDRKRQATLASPSAESKPQRVAGPKISPYAPGEIDFIAAYLAPAPIPQSRSSVIPQSLHRAQRLKINDHAVSADHPMLGVWFIIPAAELAHIKSLHLRSSAQARSKYARFRNAWHLLQSN